MNIYKKQIRKQKVFFAYLGKEAGWCSHIRGKFYGNVIKVLNDGGEALALLERNAKDTIKELDENLNAK